MSKKLSEMTNQELWQLFPIILKPHNRCYATWFDEEKQRIAPLLPMGARTSHMGSTAVKGIWAKPTVDIMVEIMPNDDIVEVTQILKENGYTAMCVEADRVDFNRGYTEDGFAERVFHLHLRRFEDNRELYFRDYLNEHPEVAKQYEALKLKLWKEFEHNRDAYTDAKSDFVNKYTAEAMILYADRYGQNGCCN